MKLSDYVVDFLAERNIRCIFEICGGAITHLLDSLHERKDIRVISMHHEQAAAFAAEGYSRIGNNISVAMATSGPGATNMITGIASCFFDSIPCMFITGQVNTYEYKFEKKIRQLGFQETDIVQIVQPIIKRAVLIRDPQKIRYELERLIFLAQSDRPGPVLLDIPMNIQRADIQPKSLKSFSPPKDQSAKKINKNTITRVVGLLKKSRRPVVLVGGGIRAAKATSELLQFIRKTGIPVVTSLMGRDAFPNTHPLFSGMIGSYGNRYANLTVANADLVLALGTRLDTRQTGTRPRTFARCATLIHVDIDSAELNAKIKADISICADVKFFLKAINHYIDGYEKSHLRDWKKTIKKYQKKYPSYYDSSSSTITPNHFMHVLSAYLPNNAVICVDVGQNQMWAAQTLCIKSSQRFLTQGGMGAMGSALPMAVGAAFAAKGPIVVITGDGGFQLNIQELQTLYHHGLAIKIILLNNSCYGMVRQFQEQYFCSRFQSTVMGYSAPDFQKVGSAFNIKTNRISIKNQIATALKKLFRDSTPALLEVKIKSTTKVLPKLSVNQPIEQQDPLLSVRELEANMLIPPLKDCPREIR